MNKEYWNNRYLDGQTGWDIGKISLPLKTYFDQLKNKQVKILIPGAGNAHEAEYLHNNGFENVYVVDLAPEVINSFSKRCPSFPKDHLILGNFFTLTGNFDLVIEQTFFCAINPALRLDYVKKMHELLEVNGKLVGVFFNWDFESGPPFGGNRKDYLKLFSQYFTNISFEACYNSITPRSGKEVFALIHGRK